MKNGLTEPCRGVMSHHKAHSSVMLNDILKCTCPSSTITELNLFGHVPTHRRAQKHRPGWINSEVVNQIDGPNGPKEEKG